MTRLRSPDGFETGLRENQAGPKPDRRGNRGGRPGARQIRQPIHDRAVDPLLIGRAVELDREEHGAFDAGPRFIPCGARLRARHVRYGWSMTSRGTGAARLFSARNSPST